MLGRTHKKIGIAASFAILQPTTVPACLGTLAAGSIGGFLCDIDILFRNHPAKDEEQERDDHYDGEWEDVASSMILFFLFIVVDNYFGSGAVDWFMSHLGIQTLVAAAVFALIIVCGMIAPHRSFMHSLIAGVTLSGCLSLICAPISPAFAIGYASHILLDLFNKTGVRVLWPIRKRFMLKLCASNKTADAILFTIAEIMCDLLVSYYLLIAVISYDRATGVFGILSAPFSDGITNLGAWIIFINIITYLVEHINFLLWRKGMFPYQNHDAFFNKERDDETASFMQRNIYILFVLGGAIGGLLSYITIGARWKEYIENGALGVAIPAFGAVSVAIEWACIYAIIVNPISTSNWLRVNFGGTSVIYMVVYLLVINVLSFVVYINDHKSLKRLTVKAFLELLIAFIGGAAGSFLAICLQGYLCAQAPLGGAVNKMLQTHCLLIIVAIVLLLSKMY